MRGTAGLRWTSLFKRFLLGVFIVFEILVPCAQAEFSQPTQLPLQSPEPTPQQVQTVSQARSWEAPPRGTLTVQYGFSLPSLDLEIKNRENGQAQSLIYKPNTRQKSYLGFDYAAFGVALGFANPQTAEQERIEGHSSSTDFQFRLYGKKFTHDLFYQRYRGYFLENTGAVFSEYSDGDAKYQRADLATEHIGTNLIYNYSPERYSLSASFDQVNRQKKSAGAWLAIASMDYHHLRADSSLVPSRISGTYGAFETLREVRALTASAGLGGGYTLVIKDFFVGGMVAFSMGYLFESIDSTLGYLERGALNLRANMRLGLGYNGPKFLAGLHFNLDNNNLPAQNADISFNTSETIAFVGYRFSDLGFEFLDRLSERLVH